MNRINIDFASLVRSRCSDGVGRAIFWGAQAASLFISAASELHASLHKRPLNVGGKLPTTTGWQPVLPTLLELKEAPEIEDRLRQMIEKEKLEN